MPEQQLVLPRHLSTSKSYGSNLVASKGSDCFPGSCHHHVVPLQRFLQPISLLLRYMFRNEEFRIELEQSLDQGEVIRWNNVFGLEKIDVVKYIELLEAEIEELNGQVARKFATGPNQLLYY